MTAELRRRKLQDSDTKTSTRRHVKNKDLAGLQRSLACLIISGTILFVVFGFYVDSWAIGNRAVDQIAKKFGYHEPVHAVVIDAGSTGSRVLAFTFHKSYLDGHLILDKELFEEIKPGLSSFAKNPKNGAATIGTLLEKAKEEIPEQFWATTPLVLKATAGLRLLPEEQADGLLNAVRDLFEKSPFLTDKTSVSIMDGTDEGIFSWFTVNFLTERLGGNPEKTIAALDLGGGSTQVTFAPTTPSTLRQTKYIHKVNAVRGIIPVYTHSYLGLGLMAARKAILTHGTREDDRVLYSACVNPFIQGKNFKYGGVDYIVNGAEDKYSAVRGNNDPVVDFEECSTIISEYIMTKVVPLDELHTKEISAFSYYYDRALETGLIQMLDGGVVTVKQFEKAAKDACNIINVDQPLMCLDLTYIWSLLQEGFNLKPETRLNLYKKINGHEISWALGAAFSILKR